MNELALFEGGGVPSHIAQMFGGNTNADLMAGIGMGFPILSYKGKTWSVMEGGERTLITNDDGDPRASLELVVIRANPTLSKVYYSGGFVEGSQEKPDCFSHDGKVPSSSVDEPQAAKCAACPMNAWGSRITENNSKGKACSDSKRMAVAAVDEIDRPMLLRVPAASLKALAQYGDLLAKRGVPVQAVLTKVRFDPQVAHPQFIFTPVRFLTQAEAEAVLEAAESEVVRQIVGIDAAPVEDHEPDAPALPAPKPSPRPAPAAAAAKPSRRPAVTEEEVAAALAAPVQAAPEPEEPPATKPAPAKAAPAAQAPARASAFGKPKLVATAAAAPKAAPAVQPKPAPAKAAPAAQTPATKPSAAAKALAEVDADLDSVLASLDD